MVRKQETKKSSDRRRRPEYPRSLVTVKDKSRTRVNLSLT